MSVLTSHPTSKLLGETGDYYHQPANRKIKIRNLAPATCLQVRKHYSTYKLVWKSMDSNHEICIVVHRAILECIAPLFCYIPRSTTWHDGDFSLLHDLGAWKHYSTYKLVCELMNSTRKIYIIAHKVIIEQVAPLWIGILPYGAHGLSITFRVAYAYSEWSTSPPKFVCKGTSATIFSNGYTGFHYRLISRF